MMTLKAPAGGTVSEVNGQWYNGGEFIPDHGLYCGKGKNRVAMAKFAEVSRKAESVGRILRYSEDRNEFQLWRTEKFACGEQHEKILFSARSLATLEKLCK